MTTTKTGRARKMTAMQKRVLSDLANGGRFFAALRHSEDWASDDVLFSEGVGIIVHPTSDRTTWYRVRNKTAAPLYLHEPALVIESDPEIGGHREYIITDAGRALIIPAQRGKAKRKGK